MMVLSLEPAGIRFAPGNGIGVWATPQSVGHPIDGNAYGDCDGCPTQAFVIERRDDQQYKRFYDRAFAKRPAEELYDLHCDPHQLQNVAGQPDDAEAKKKLESGRTTLAELNATRDPRIIGAGDEVDDFPYRRRVRGSRGLP